MHTNAMEGPANQAGGFGAEIQSAVRTELESILAAPAFSQSSRCKRFLSHVVRQALSGNSDQLKERIIGVRVFERAADYDTGEDSIVRVTANEVRKRISQFYQESRGSHSIQIDLPRGSYVPDFKIHPAGHGNGAETNTTSESLQSHPAANPSVASAAPLIASLDEPVTAIDIHSPANRKASGRFGFPHVWASVAVLILLAGTVAVLFGLWSRSARSDVPEVWKAFLESKTPVLVCLGTHDLPLSNPAPAAGTEDVVMRTETIPIDDATVLTAMAKSLATKGIPFRLVAAAQTSLTDLEAQPVILIGAVDNKWTLQLTQALRYRIMVDFPFGSDKPPVATIVDSQHSANAVWKIDFSVPLSAWKSDYAIVARENDASIGVPVLIEAGLGNTGSLAASSLVTSGALANVLENDRTCRNRSNFEAVIGTGIIDSRPGPPHILRLACW